MHELELAGHPSIDSERPRGFRAPSSRTAIIVSSGVHVLAFYALTLQQFSDAPAPRTVADYFVFDLPASRPEPLPEPEAVPEAAPAERPVERREVEPPAPAPEVEPERSVVVEPAAPAAEAAPVEERVAGDEAAPLPVGEAPIDEAPIDEADAFLVPPPSVDFDEERRRAAREVVTERSTQPEYLTFSMDDVAPPRPEPDERPPSIFDGGGGPDFGNRSVGTVGQQRTRIGRKLAEFCNALTGGFGVAFQGFGLFSACASPDGGPTGFFPEVRPAYLDLMPECVDTRDTAPALALDAPFPLVKCRLVKREEVGDQP